MRSDLTVAFIGLGSNLENPVRQVRSAMCEIDGYPSIEILASSSLYSSPPMGPPDQPHFINAVVKIRTSATSFELLRVLQGIEHQHGRVRNGVHWGPRTLDLDLLLFGNLTSNTPQLVLPHPGLKQRDFVVLPLFEIAPELVLPCGTAVADLARSFSEQDGALRLADE